MPRWQRPATPVCPAPPCPLVSFSARSPVLGWSVYLWPSRPLQESVARDTRVPEHLLGWSAPWRLTRDSVEVGLGDVLRVPTRSLGLLASSSCQQPCTFCTAGTGAEGAGKARTQLGSGSVYLGSCHPGYPELKKGANPSSLQTRISLFVSEISSLERLAWDMGLRGQPGGK